jgi:hypothetical protein
MRLVQLACTLFIETAVGGWRDFPREVDSTDLRQRLVATPLASTECRSRPTAHFASVELI